MRTTGHQLLSASTPDSGLSSPPPSSSDCFYAFLPQCLCAVCSWVVPSVSCPVDSRSESAWGCCWRASWGCVSSLCVAGSSPPSLPLWVPGQSLAADVAGWLPEGVANPTLDLPLLLLPRGFQVRAWLLMLLAGFLRVWPIQPWVFPSFSSPVGSRSEPACWCCWLASWGCGQTKLTFLWGSV